VPIICIESRQARQTLKPLATHKTDRNDARGLAQLARTGFLKSVHVKSLHAHAIRSLIAARKKLVGQRVTQDRSSSTRGVAERNQARVGCRRGAGAAHVSLPPIFFRAPILPWMWRAVAIPASCAACTAMAERSPKAQ
jgi:transposase